VVYADREHFANLSYLTGYDPRFEESLLIMVPGRAPVLLVGNEGVSYAAVVPPEVEVVLYQSFSLVSQDRSASPRLGAVLASAGLGSDGGVRQVGVAGWKWFGPSEASDPTLWVDAPAFIVDVLRFMAEVLGISLKPEVLPLSNLAGYLPPFWLSPQLAMRRK